ncbi:MAG: nucleoside monophosphate kinase [Candidatus Gracilibacteria bacterium]|nr:nucleoside monophosphate kinase [Candidatus Gracilibacteria bacterium]
MKLVFTGIQGCGKGTQARLLVEKYGFTLLEMGGEFRKIINSGTELGNEIKKIVDAGFQVPGELGIKVMETAINNNLSIENIVYDAFVRNEWNKEIFDRLLPEYKVVFFELPIEKAKNRLLGRMYDEKTGETFQAGTITNPITGDRLIRRNDDKDEGAILNRISEFENKTLPIVELQKKENRVITVNADQSIENVFNELVTKLGL